MLHAKQNLFKKMLHANQTSKVRGRTNIQEYWFLLDMTFKHKNRTKLTSIQQHRFLMNMISKHRNRTKSKSIQQHWFLMIMIPKHRNRTKLTSSFAHVSLQSDLTRHSYCMYLKELSDCIWHIWNNYLTCYFPPTRIWTFRNSPFTP